MFGIRRKAHNQEAAPNASAVAPAMQSDIRAGEARSGRVLMLVSFAMLGVFIAGVVMFGGEEKTKNTNPFAVAESVSEEAGAPAAVSVPAAATALLSATPSRISLWGSNTGEAVLDQIQISGMERAVRVMNVFASQSVDGVSIGNDCVELDGIDLFNRCSITVSFVPYETLSRSFSVEVQYVPEDETDAASMTLSIPVEVSFTAPAPAAPPAPPAFNPFEEENEFEDFAEPSWESQPVPTPQPVRSAQVAAPEPQISDAIAQGMSCRNFASKVYDFSGVFIGWAQGNRNVYSPNCRQVIGTLQDDGMVIASRTGQIIGKGIVHDQAKAHDRRINLVLPILDEVLNARNANNFNPNIDDVINNRMIAKEGGVGRPCEDEDDCHRLPDPLGIRGRGQKGLVPFTIDSKDYVSSNPKDERFVLRQGKPIPAVLVRPIYVSQLVDGTAPDQLMALATVERNVYGGDGRTIVVPAGSQLIGFAEPPNIALDNPLETIVRVQLGWERLIRPDGAEFKLAGNTIDGTGPETSTTDAQGRDGVPGRVDPEYMKSFFMRPLLYSALPVAMEALFPTSSQFAVTQRVTDGQWATLGGAVFEDEVFGDELTGVATWNPDMAETAFFNMTPRDKMKMEIQQNWKAMAQKMIHQSLRQRKPFTVPAGTRIQVYLARDIMLRISDDEEEAVNLDGF